MITISNGGGGTRVAGCNGNAHSATYKLKMDEHCFSICSLIDRFENLYQPKLT